MKYFEHETGQKKNINFDEISLNDYNTQKLLNNQSYQNYLREFSNNTNEKLKNKKQLEEIFKNEIYYSALKKLPLQEKRVFYLSLFKRLQLDEICKRERLSKKEAIRIKELSIEHFIKNVHLLEKQYFNNKTGEENE